MASERMSSRMIADRLRFGLWWLLAFTPIAALSDPAPSQNPKIPPWTLQLEQRLQPWCPEDCEEGIPFTASYRTAEYVLVFVGAH